MCLLTKYHLNRKVISTLSILETSLSSGGNNTGTYIYLAILHSRNIQTGIRWILSIIAFLCRINNKIIKLLHSFESFQPIPAGALLDNCVMTTLCT
jgi:hypothetical protein